MAAGRSSSAKQCFAFLPFPFFCCVTRAGGDEAETAAAQLPHEQQPVAVQDSNGSTSKQLSGSKSLKKVQSSSASKAAAEAAAAPSPADTAEPAAEQRAAAAAEKPAAKPGKGVHDKFGHYPSSCKQAISWWEMCNTMCLTSTVCLQQHMAIGPVLNT
jgi:hypothetical protein